MDKKILVAFFSPTHATGRVAKELAHSENADLFEIIPEQPYTGADMNWMDEKSRTTSEMNNPACRPAVAGKVENMDQYDEIFIGFPIWWGVAPRIINTFLESYDLSGKKVIPFATSGGSGMDLVNASIENSVKGAHLEEGKILNGPHSESDLKYWADTFGLDA